MPTCYGTVRDTSSPATATIREPSRITSDIGTSATQSGTPSYHRRDSKIFGGIELPRAPARSSDPSDPTDPIPTDTDPPRQSPVRPFDRDRISPQLLRNRSRRRHSPKGPTRRHAPEEETQTTNRSPPSAPRKGRDRDATPPERLRAASGSSAIKTTGRRESVLSSRGRLACRAFGTRSTPRAPEPSPELSLDALDVGTRRERSHPGNDLRGGGGTPPRTEKTRPHSLGRRHPPHTP